MATDPTKQITRRRFLSPFTMGEENLLERLAHLDPSTDVPYLTVTVDWRPEGTSPGRAEPEEVKRSQRRSGQEAEGERWRPAIEILERDVENLIEEHGPRGDVYDSLKSDYEKLMHFLQDELDPAAHGAIVVANSAKGVFVASGLSLPLETSITTGPVPSLYPVMRLVEDNPVYAVLLADQEEARLDFISYGRLSRQSEMESSLYPVKQQQGGWSQRRYQARADERVEAFARDIAEETRTRLDRLGVDSLIVAGAEVMTSALDHAFHQSVKDRIVGTIRMETWSSDSEVIEATLPMLADVERKREEEAVRNLRDHVGAKTRGAAGVADTLRALQNGQAGELVVLDTFEAKGWADYGMHVFGVDNHPTQHPVGGNVADIVDVNLRDELVRLALQTDADVEVIHSDVPVPEGGEVPDADDERPVTKAAKELQEIGGVGAVLRFEMDETAPPESV